jgi:hypothetical protein
MVIGSTYLLRTVGWRNGCRTKVPRACTICTALGAVIRPLVFLELHDVIVVVKLECRAFLISLTG